MHRLEELCWKFDFGVSSQLLACLMLHAMLKVKYWQEHVLIPIVGKQNASFQDVNMAPSSFEPTRVRRHFNSRKIDKPTALFFLYLMFKLLIVQIRPMLSLLVMTSLLGCLCFGIIRQHKGCGAHACCAPVSLPFSSIYTWWKVNLQSLYLGVR